MFESIGFFLKNPEPSQVVRDCCEFLSQKGIKLSVIRGENQKPFDHLPLREPGEVDLILSFGGDGTMLQLARTLGNSETPILGINQGKIGFLTALSENEVISKLTPIVLNGRFQKHERSRIQCQIGSHVFHALNEIVIRTSKIARVGHFTFSLSNGESFSFTADGIIVATATGSTGYNLAAGGPILPYGSNLFVMTPICPYKYRVRAIILPENSKASIKITGSGSPFGITVDGQQYLEFSDLNQTVKISRSPKKIHMIYPEDFKFLNVLQKKLNFGGTLAG